MGYVQKGSSFALPHRFESGRPSGGRLPFRSGGRLSEGLQALGEPSERVLWRHFGRSPRTTRRSLQSPLAESYVGFFGQWGDQEPMAPWGFGRPGYAVSCSIGMNRELP
jgi:hypothetical protein